MPRENGHRPVKAGKVADKGLPKRVSIARPWLGKVMKMKVRREITCWFLFSEACLQRGVFWLHGAKSGPWLNYVQMVQQFQTSNKVAAAANVCEIQKV